MRAAAYKCHFQRNCISTRKYILYKQSFLQNNKTENKHVAMLVYALWCMHMYVSVYLLINYLLNQGTNNNTSNSNHF